MEAQPAPADKKLTLDRVEKHFEHWRRAREKKGTGISSGHSAAIVMNFARVAKEKKKGFFCFSISVPSWKDGNYLNDLTFFNQPVNDP